MVGPATIWRMGKAWWVTHERIKSERSSGSGRLAASDSFNRPEWVAWKANTFADDGTWSAKKVYHTIPSSGAGSEGTHYDRSAYAYDGENRLIKRESPDGTIRRWVYGPMGRISSLWVGTNDTGATGDDPDAGGGSNNMAKLVGRVYDQGSDEDDGNLTKVTRHVDGSTTRVTTHSYDWRNRRRSTDGEVDRYFEFAYDNLGRQTQIERYDTDSTGNLVARTERSYDDRGRVYEQIQYEVDPATGNVGTSMTRETWYDAAGNVIKRAESGSDRFTKRAIDGLGQVTTTYTGFDSDESTHGEATDVAGDTILTQRERTYNAAGALIEQARYDRRHDDGSTTGSLSSASARVTYQAFWYDGGDRRIASARYGTNGGSSLNRPSTVPSRSDNTLVSSVAYNAAGRRIKQTGPDGQATRFYFDAKSRTTYKIENYDGSSGLWNTEPSDPASRDSDVNRITATTYTPDNQRKTLTAVDPDADGDTADNQVTTYVYGTATGASSPRVHRNDLRRATIYPDSDDPADLSAPGSDGVYDRVERTHNRLGELKTKKDPRGVVHTFEYDKLGRQTHDRVTNLGRSSQNVAGSVRRISREYTVRGNVATITSYDDAAVGSGAIVNEVTRAYDGYAQLESSEQDHKPSGGYSAGVPTVQYSRAPRNGNGNRLESVTYPDGRVIHTTYGGNYGIDSAINRPTGLAKDNSGSVGQALVTYDRMGSGRAAQVAYPELSLQLVYADSGTSGYAGWDRFGRVARPPARIVSPK